MSGNFGPSNGNFAKGYGAVMTVIGVAVVIFVVGVIVGTIFGTVMTAADRPTCVTTKAEK